PLQPTASSRAGFLKPRGLRRRRWAGRSAVGQPGRKRLLPCKNCLLNLMSITKLKAGLLGAAVVIGAGTPLVVQQQSLSHLRAENRDLRERSQPLAPPRKD